MKRIFATTLVLILFLCILSTPALADKLPQEFVPEALVYYYNTYLSDFVQEDTPEEEQELIIQSLSLEYIGTYGDSAYYDNSEQTVEMACYYADGDVKTNQPPDAISFVVFNDWPESARNSIKLLFSWALYNARRDDELFTAWQWRENTTEDSATFALDGYTLYCTINDEFESITLIGGNERNVNNYGDVYSFN